MNHPVFVRFGKPIRNLLGNRKCVFDSKHPPSETCLQRFCFVKSHRDEWLAVSCGANFVDRTDVGMVQNGRGASLEQETLLGVRLRREVRRKELQRDMPPETLVACLMNEPHGASP